MQQITQGGDGSPDEKDVHSLGDGVEVLPPGVQVVYDADQHAADRAKKAYKVDGKLYVPRRKTGRLVEEIIRMAPEEEPDENDREAQAKGVRTLYEQVSKLLVHISDGETNPDVDGLMDVLDLEDAREMVEKLMGNQRQDPPQS